MQDCIAISIIIQDTKTPLDFGEKISQQYPFQYFQNTENKRDVKDFEGAAWRRNQ